MLEIKNEFCSLEGASRVKCRSQVRFLVSVYFWCNPFCCISSPWIRLCFFHVSTGCLQATLSRTDMSAYMHLGSYLGWAMKSGVTALMKSVDLLQIYISVVEIKSVFRKPWTTTSQDSTSTKLPLKSMRKASFLHSFSHPFLTPFCCPAWVS